VGFRHRSAYCDPARRTLTLTEQTTIKVFQTVSPSVVHVFAQATPQSSLFAEPEEGVVQSGFGIVWDAAGHVITNYHVIKGSSQIGARLTSGEFVAARVVGTAPSYDLAMLQPERTRSVLQPIAVGRSANLQIGQDTFVCATVFSSGPRFWDQGHVCHTEQMHVASVVGELLTSSREGEGIMFGHAGRHDGIDVVLRANRVLVLSLMWAAFAACAVSSLAYDVGHWLNAW